MNRQAFYNSTIKAITELAIPLRNTFTWNTGEKKTYVVYAYDRMKTVKLRENLFEFKGNQLLLLEIDYSTF